MTRFMLRRRLATLKVMSTAQAQPGGPQVGQDLCNMDGCEGLHDLEFDHEAFVYE